MADFARAADQLGQEILERLRRFPRGNPQHGSLPPLGVPSAPQWGMLLFIPFKLAVVSAESFVQIYVSFRLLVEANDPSGTKKRRSIGLKRNTVGRQATKITRTVLFAQIAMGMGSLAAQAGGFSLMDFRVEGVGAFNETGNSFSAMVSYLPAYGLLEKLDLKGNFGASAYRAVGSELMGVLNAGALASYRVIPSLALEAGGGVQTWLGYELSPMGNANVAWVPETPVLGRINKVVVGYSRLFQELPTSEVRVGIELNFGTVLKGNQPAQKDATTAAK